MNYYIRKRLSDNEERALITIIKSTNDQNVKNSAINKIILNHLPFIIGVAKRYRNNRMDMEELVNEGIFGIRKAIMNYNPDREVRFLSYAVWWIRQTIQDAIYNQSNDVRIPDNNINKIYTLLHKTKNEDELYEAMCMADGGTLRLFSSWNAMNAVPMSAPVAGSRSSDSTKDMEIGETIGGENLVQEKYKQRNRELMMQLLKDNTTPDEMTLIEKYYGLNNESENTFKELGEMRGISRERVRVLKNASLRRLKKKMEGVRFMLEDGQL